MSNTTHTNSAIPPRAMSDVQFAAFKQSLAEGTFDVHAVPSSSFAYGFDRCGHITVGIMSISTFLSDVDAIMAERNQLASDLKEARSEINSLRDDIQCRQTVETNLRESIQVIAKKRGDREDAVAELQDEVKRLTGALHSCDANYKMADRALSCRNDTIAAMEKLAEVRAAESNQAINVLHETIERKNRELGNLRCNVTSLALQVGEAQRAQGRAPVKLELFVHADGSVSLQTEAPFNVTAGNSVFKGDLRKARGEVAA